MALHIHPKYLVRIAAALMLFHTLGHSMGALNWKKAPNAQVGLVIQGMETTHFDFMGRSASLGKFYNGYGIIMIAVLLLLSFQLWILGGDTGTRTTNRLLTALGVFMIAMAGLEYVYFFTFAASVSFLAGACVVISLLMKKQAN